MLLPANLRRYSPSFLHVCLLSIAGMSSKTSLISKEKALPGRSEAMVVAGKHAVSGHPVKEPFPEEMERVIFGMGCFWGAERRFWKTPGVYSTHVGYAGGFTVNPLYKEVCSGMRQGKDVGTQYRSVIYTYIPYQLEMALKSKEVYQKMLNEKKLGTITTEIKEAPEFYYAEDYHQQYLHKVPNGYCGLKGTGVSCPIGLSQREDL
ncbi:peptide methionine sulfoxide reductase MsrA-like isoform X3 [Polypterus senegalus]|uniref:peptide methionine sulfoxide reductase MsrA-like isoform X3 n=1 Tax=Polypterus senegalus TaxID=55291 RepID=UPI001965098E|nr:peptide methionine sulfoxide reductase MsrA-like isoform X3 [Polypterus senegalus]